MEHVGQDEKGQRQDIDVDPAREGGRAGGRAGGREGGRAKFRQAFFPSRVRMEVGLGGGGCEKPRKEKKEGRREGGRERKRVKR